MQQARLIMGMPVTVAVVDDNVDSSVFDKLFSYCKSVDEQFSTYKATSEVSLVNHGERAEKEYSSELREVLSLAKATQRATNGYFNTGTTGGTIDPSGIVKGWAIQREAQQLDQLGYKHFYIDAGGDIQSRSENEHKEAWSIGIRNPFHHDEIINVVYPHGAGVATSGTSVRGQHIYNPYHPTEPITGIVSLTVIASDVLEADRFAAAAFATGARGIEFIVTREWFSIGIGRVLSFFVLLTVASLAIVQMKILLGLMAVAVIAEGLLLRSLAKKVY
ncbi:FAD:protein FMN transferase [Candidatus Uhrbacteria bacterium CG10_big_fil_rev_8_21_14_0_10_48_11]|uniref:FAD:protein FMN transferase n=1 Tax=Candidatus Uhrbacteria bacterium CG10_big_fil_rev_8_21_14_0_10_48_11 TaxID=1975037 RepID=A0A2M8LF76_9BACT|nr:MAG: FAD:protein FMN transferase [Candidatus Uhrbacteria bacterium CG10_big_fil_rev_8_21_14_0_10_48_11]